MVWRWMERETSSLQTAPASASGRWTRPEPSPRLPVEGVAAPVFVGDGGPATEATLHFPRGLAVDGAGNLFIADTQNHRIRKVDCSGVITTVAGNGTSGFSGDGGPATEASLAAPGGVAVDSAGNLFIADHDNHRIRKMDAAGIISTVAGNGRARGRARTQTQGLGGDGGPATAANLDSPGGVTVDGAGNLFIAEGQRVRKVDPSGIISAPAPLPADYRFARAVVVDGAGNLFLAEGGSRILAGGGRILKVDPSGTITTVAGYAFDLVGDGGPATSARLVNPQAVAVDGAGNVFISDVGARGMQTGVAQRIRKVDASSIITTVAGNGTTDFSGDGGPATLASLGGPRGVAVDGTGNLFIADGRYHRVRKVDAAGIISTVAGNGTGCPILGPLRPSDDGGPATNASLCGLSGIAVDGAGNLFIADARSIRKVDPLGHHHDLRRKRYPRLQRRRRSGPPTPAWVVSVRSLWMALGTFSSPIRTPSVPEVPTAPRSCSPSRASGR